MVEPMHLSDAQIRKYSRTNTNCFICLDTETTGLEPGKDEVLSLAVVDQDGNELFNHLVKPAKRRRWPKAAEIHGITWQDVKDEKELLEYKDEIMALFSPGKLMVGYNVDFDLQMLRYGGIPIPAIDSFDLMEAFAEAHGEWAEWKNDYKWMKLSECASYYGYRLDAHDALNDTRATAYCYKAFVKECRIAMKKTNSPNGGVGVSEDTVGGFPRESPSTKSVVGAIVGFIVALSLLGLAIFLFVSGYIWIILVVVVIALIAFSKAK